MAVFSYKAYSDKGRYYKAKFEAPSLLEAKRLLIEQGIQLLQIKENKISKQPKVPLSTILHFTEELSQLLDAGLPLFESLTLLKEQFAREAFSDILYSLTQSLESGSSFSKALSNYPKCFSPLYCSLVQVGEESGYLDQALKKIIRDYERQNKLKKKVQAALIYPSILLFFCMILIHLMMFYIVPSLENLFDPANSIKFTQLVIAISHHLKKWEWIYIALSTVSFLLIKWKIKDPKFKPHLDACLLKAPLLKAFILDLALSKFSSTMSMLLNGGVPLLESLLLCKNLVHNQVVCKSIKELIHKIESGEKLSTELKRDPLFPPLFSRIVIIGEGTGELPKSFEKLASHYEESVEKKLSKLMTLLSPLILLIMGVIIGAVMLGILIPLTDINSLSI